MRSIFALNKRDLRRFEKYQILTFPNFHTAVRCVSTLSLLILPCLKRSNSLLSLQIIFLSFMFLQTIWEMFCYGKIFHFDRPTAHEFLDELKVVRKYYVLPMNFSELSFVLLSIRFLCVAQSIFSRFYFRYHHKVQDAARRIWKKSRTFWPLTHSYITPTTVITNYLVYMNHKSDTLESRTVNAIIKLWKLSQEIVFLAEKVTQLWVNLTNFHILHYENLNENSITIFQVLWHFLQI